ncbi:unnamed protein product [Soboliphyme baturini]|uniref:Dimethylargininase n=1 Tax=Soboliphyme baturini TaxID=241478 RepID=A0A183IW34_9BILA|nr:unnamed protein product [Soboliphyme baturini]
MAQTTTFVYKLTVRKIMSRFTHAVVSRVPDFVSETSISINTTKLRKELELFCDKLREAGVDVMELAPEQRAAASSLFVGDVAIVSQGIALVTPTTRASKEFFVGLTKWTNYEGAVEVAKTFPDSPVTAIKVDGPNHLKNYVSLAAPGIFAVGQSDEARKIIKRIEREAAYKYHIITLDDETGANCLNVNGTLMYRGDGQQSEKILNLTEFERCPLDMREMGNCGGILSQYCLLLRKIRLSKSVNEL